MLRTFMMGHILVLLVGCAPKSAEPRARDLPEASQDTDGQEDTEVSVVEVFVEDELVDPVSLESEAGQLASRVLDLSEFGTPFEVLSALGLSVERSSLQGEGVQPQTDVRPGWLAWQVDAAGKKVRLMMQLKSGTWERPRGNSPPRFEPPEVSGVTLSGAGYLSAPDWDVASQVFDYHDGSRRKMWVHGHTYMEQGHQGRPWMVARFDERAPFHTTQVWRDEVEDLLIRMASAAAGGEDDLQGWLAREAAPYQVGPNVYDLGAARLEAQHPYYVRVFWTAASRLPKFFESVGVGMLMTSFAYDYGEMSHPAELSWGKLGFDYYIRDETSREAEMGRASDAWFRGLTFSLNR